MGRHITSLWCAIGYRDDVVLEFENDDELPSPLTASNAAGLVLQPSRSGEVHRYGVADEASRSHVSVRTPSPVRTEAPSSRNESTAGS